MDPLQVFPPEIVHHIFSFLTPQELLPVRAVASHWLSSVTSCPDAWLTEFSNDWREYLEVRKVIRRWKSKRVRYNVYYNVKECQLTEIALYILFFDGRLEMRDTSGNTIRIFDQMATTLHLGDNCLYVGIQLKPNNARVHDTLLTDFCLNVIDTLPGVQITTASSNGIAFLQDGNHFLEMNNVRVPILDVSPQFLTTCAVLLSGFIVKTVQLFDSHSSTFKDLKSISSSPRWIPSIQIILGSDDFFCVLVEQRDFNSVFVYDQDNLLFDNSYTEVFKCFFIGDYFFLSFQEQITLFNLKSKRLFAIDLPDHLNIRNIQVQKWSLLKNLFVVFNLLGFKLSDPTYWRIYWLSDKKFPPKVKKITSNATYPFENIGVSHFDFLSKYAFRLCNDDLSANVHGRNLQIIFFEL